MTATLADVNKSLLSVAENTEKTSRGINAFLQNLEEQKREELEAERERMALQLKNEKQAMKDAAKAKDSSSGSGTGFKLPSLGLGKLLTIGGLTTAAVTLGKGLLMRGVPGLALTALSDEIADYFVKGEGQEKLRGQFAAALKGAGIGFTLFGRKGFVLGGIFEFLRKDSKVDEELGNLVDNLEVLGKTLFGEFSFAAIGKKITEKAGSGLESLNKLISGKSFTEGNITSIANDMQGAATVLGVFGFLVSSRFRKALLSIRGLKKLAVFSGLLALAKTFGYTMTPDKEGVPVSERPDMLDYGLAGGAAAYATVKGVQVAKNMFANRSGASPQLNQGKGNVSSYNTKITQAGKLSEKQLNKSNLTKKGGGVQDMSGKFASHTQLDKALSGKYPRLIGGIKSFGRSVWPLGLLFSLMDSKAAADILGDPTISEEEKKKQVGGLIASNFSALGFGALGAALGGIIFPPKGIAIGAGLGSALGYMFPAFSGYKIADFLMGGSGKLTEAEKKQYSQEGMSSLFSGLNTGKGYSNESGPIGAKGTSQFQDISSLAGQGAVLDKRASFYRNSPTSASTLGTGLSGYSGMNFGNNAAASDGGVSLAVNAPSSSQAALFNDGPAIDLRDQLALRYGTN